MSSIKFYKPEDETLPTKLRLLINDKVYVMYDWLDDNSGYDFQFIGVTESQALSYTKEIIAEMYKYIDGVGIKSIDLINDKNSKFKGGIIVRAIFENEVFVPIDVDEIFLLPLEEYEKYKDNIPKLNILGWMRSPIGDFNSAIRPCLKISSQESENLKIGDRLIKYAFPWIKISNNLAIAEVPVGFYRFDKKPIDYKNSEIRQYLLNWVKERK